MELQQILEHREGHMRAEELYRDSPMFAFDIYRSRMLRTVHTTYTLQSITLSFKQWTLKAQDYQRIKKRRFYFLDNENMWSHVGQSCFHLYQWVFCHWFLWAQYLSIKFLLNHSAQDKAEMILWKALSILNRLCQDKCNGLNP